MSLRNRCTWSFALRGLAAVLLGLGSLMAPQWTFLSVVLLFGVYAILDGVLAFAVRPRAGSRLVHIARGVISFVAGSFALAWPGLSAFALVLVIASWAIAAGIVEVITAVQLRKEVRGEWLLAVEGTLSIVFGALLFVAPLVGVIVIGLWIGAYALVLGGMLIASAFHSRSPREASAGA